jgi:protein arginine N-methyltransferase 7
VTDIAYILALLVSSLSPSSKVIPMFPGLRDKGASYLQLQMETISLWTKFKRLVKERHKVNLLVGEPFYFGGEGMLLGQNLRFCYDNGVLENFLPGVADKGRSSEYPAAAFKDKYYQVIVFLPL